MSKSVFSALAAALTLTLGVAATSVLGAEQPPAPDLTQSLLPVFRAAQAAEKAKRWPEVIAKAQEVLANGKRKPDDTYYAYYLLFEANRELGNKDEQLIALKGLVNSGFLTADQAAPYTNAVMGLAFQARDYDTAIDYGTRLTKSGNADPRVFTTIGQSYYQKGDYAESARFFRSLVDEQVKRGQKPLEQNLIMLHSSYDKLHNREGTTHALELLVVYYPKKQFWDALLYSVRSDSDLQPREKLQVYRLMLSTGTLDLRQDYNKFAELALLVGLPAEAEKVYEAGLKADVFTPESEQLRAKRLMESAAKAAETDRADLKKLEAAAASASNGEDAVVLGMAYYSYGQYDKAVDALQSALAKGGIKEDLEVEVRLVLGISQLRNKDNAAALKTFQDIKTDNPRMQRIANLWELYARS